MHVLHRYLMVIVAGISLLFGIQVPNFVDQYQKRVDAHLSEVSRNLLHYQGIADKHYQGNLKDLIRFHRDNADPAIQEEGVAIASMHRRMTGFESDGKALQTTLPWKVAHLLMSGDRELLQETMDRYSYSIPLTQEAIIAGVVVTMTLVLTLELVLALLKALLVALFRPRRSRPYDRADVHHRLEPFLTVPESVQTTSKRARRMLN
ncbi:DUF2937 family protein [Gammaproteobacteria bacterium]